MKDISRRDFLRFLGVGAIGLIARPRLSQALERLGKNVFPGRGEPAHLFASDVVQCYDDNATSGSTVNEPVVQVMTDASIKALTGINDLGEAWKSVFPGIAESSVISVKVNCINSSCSTRHELVNCIVNGLAQMNFGGNSYRRNNVIIWDRTDSELTSAGYTIYTGADPNTVRCFGTSHSGIGYDTGHPLNVNGVTSNPSRILSLMSNYLINAAVLKTHQSISVVTMGLKNHYGSVNNPGSLHANQANPSIPSLNQQIRDVLPTTNIQKLTITDALWGIYSGGPADLADFNPKLILMSRDVVACDYQGQNVINAERLNHGLGDVNAPSITTAAQPPYNLGTTDVNLILINNPSSIEESETAALADGIVEVSPHPFRDAATITLSLARASAVEVDLLNPAGRTAAQIYNGRLAPGRHQIPFRAQHRLAGGTYFLRLNLRSGIRNQKSGTVRKVTVLN
jgi:hypothetical protein